MKARTIKKVLRAKVDEWLASIEDLTVRDLAGKNTIVTGGCIASMLLREPVNDFDIYFRTKEAAIAVAEYYVPRLKIKKRAGIECKMWVEDGGDRVKVVVKSAGIVSENGTDKPYDYFEDSVRAEDAGDYVAGVLGDPGDIEDKKDGLETAAQAVEDEDDGPKYRPAFLSTNAISLSNRVQIVLRFFGEPDEIHANYDFVHCTNMWTSWDDDLVLRPKALEALLARELVYTGSKYPLCSLFRLRKFLARQWTVNAGQILKIAMQVSQLDMTNHKVLADQLTGVDCAYFIEVIGKLKEKDPEKVNTAYLVEIIDRVF